MIFRGYKGVYASGQFASVVAITSGWLSKTENRIFTRHHSDENHLLGRFNLALYRAFLSDRLTNKLATKIIAVSPVVYEILIAEEGAPCTKVRQISNGIEENKLSELRESDVNTKKLRIGVMSRMTRVKGVEYIADAFAQFNEIYGESELLIVGAKSELYPKILKRLDGVPDDKYKFIDKVENNQDFFSEIDVFIHAPVRKYAEAFGLVYLEGIASGKICIYSESGILLNNEALCSYYQKVNYRDSTDIFKKLIDIAESPIKSVQKVKLPSDFTLETMEDRYASFWKELI
jgi:glycosyltransferase involved in cell wall biosynthesis